MGGGISDQKIKLRGYLWDIWRVNNFTLNKCDEKNKFFWALQNKLIKKGKINTNIFSFSKLRETKKHIYNKFNNKKQNSQN